MALYRVEALKRNALGLHGTVDFHEFDGPDLPAALAAADTWLRAKGFDQTTATDRSQTILHLSDRHSIIPRATAYESIYAFIGLPLPR
jgi:hypothetical protein